jgi:cellulose synthase/poly-beta-1,6-N-acetylglucosamine synthase-like glycosyltransferase
MKGALTVLARRRADRLVPHYISADTAPDDFAVTRHVFVGPLFLLLFAAVTAALTPALPRLLAWYGELVATLAHVPRWEVLGKGGSLSFRPFLLLLIVLLSAFAVGPLAQRAKVLAFSATLYAASVVLFDVFLAKAQDPLVPPFSQAGGIAAGLLGFVVIVVTVFLRYHLPAGIRVETRWRSRHSLAVLGACVAVSVGLVVSFSLVRSRYFEDLHVRFVGWLDSELVLFLLAVVTLLVLVRALDRTVKPLEGPELSVAFLIPAYNEAEGIADCIRSLDAAARRYGRHCALYVVDNGSWDDTRKVAESAIAQCAHLDGTVLQCLVPGKARALNHGLEHVTEDIVVRIDADTLVEPSLLVTLIPWFWDPSVGGVGGLPLPKVTAPRWLYPLRIIEVYYGIAFLRVAQTAADAVMVMPGLIASYRRDVLEELAGFGEGFNGEDADITMRIGRLGYRIVTDPHVRVYTEVPATLAHLREQRQRWARGLFHMAGRNISSIWMRQGARGVWNLPWSIFNASKRSMMIPILVCALTVELIDPTVFSLREVSVVAGFLVGLQLIVISVLLVAYRKFGILPFVPTYLVFRLLRAYIAFETILTLRLRRQAPKQRFEIHAPLGMAPNLHMFRALTPVEQDALTSFAFVYPSLMAQNVRAAARARESVPGAAVGADLGGPFSDRYPCDAPEGSFDSPHGVPQ